MVMSQDGVNKSRRTLLVGTTTALGAVGAGFVAVPFVKSWNPSERAKAAGAPAKVDVSKLESGAMIVVEWRGKRVFVTSGDGKSTRLNSSHVRISYAVFCLKKKNMSPARERT